jgi:hypothetical protein
MTIEPGTAHEKPEDPGDPGDPGWKVVILAILTLVSFAAIVLVAMQGQAPAATAIGVAWAASCTVLAVIWKR